MLMRSRYSAIMQGAVLHKLGLDFVKARVLRLNYGISFIPIFEVGHHPSSRKFLHVDGQERCRGVMHWFARKD